MKDIVIFLFSIGTCTQQYYCPPLSVLDQFTVVTSFCHSREYHKHNYVSNSTWYTLLYRMHIATVSAINPIDVPFRLTRRKHPDRLADSCKRLSINRMAASSRLPTVGPVRDFLSLLHLFKHNFCNNFKQAVGPGVLQTFSTYAVKP